MGLTKTIRNAIGGLSGLFAPADGAMRAPRNPTPLAGPPSGRVYVYNSTLDAYRTYFTEGIDFTRLRTYLQAGDQGDLATVLQMFEEFEEKDTHLASVSNTRRMGLTGLEWEVVSAADAQKEIKDRALADEAAAYVRETLTNLKTFEPCLEHLANGIGPNLAVAEIVWEAFKPIELVAIPANRLTAMRFGGNTGFKPVPQVDFALRIITAQAANGVEPEADKFIIHMPRSRCGFPFKGSLSRAQAALYVIKNMVLRGWVQYCEVFGQPARFAKYRTNASLEEKEEALAMLENMGAHAWGLFSEAVDLELKESSQRGTSPHEILINWCERKQSMLWLGGHLMVDTTNATGTHAAGAVQEQVREDLRDDDIRRESRTIREQLIAPMCRFRFPAVAVPLPHFRRCKPEILDRQNEANLFNTVTQTLGLPVERAYIYSRLGVPEPEKDPVTGAAKNPVIVRSNPFEEGVL